MNKKAFQQGYMNKEAKRPGVGTFLGDLAVGTGVMGTGMAAGGGLGYGLGKLIHPEAADMYAAGGAILGGGGSHLWNMLRLMKKYEKMELDHLEGLEREGTITPQEQNTLAVLRDHQASGRYD